MRNLTKISVFLVLVAMLSQTASAKTAYFNMSWHPTVNRYCLDTDCGCNLCEPYPIDFYGTFSPVVTPPVNTRTRVTPNASNIYCTFHPNSDTLSDWGWNTCRTSAPSKTSLYGRGWETNETGTIPSGTWVIGLNTTSNVSGGAGIIQVYVWKTCAMNVSQYGTRSDTLLFVANTSQNHVAYGSHLETITLNNMPSFNFGSGKGNEFCYLIAEYHLNVSTGTTSSTTRVTLVGGVSGTNITYPTPVNLMNSVTMNSPQTDLNLDGGQTFLMNCTPSTDDSAYGINMSFEYNYTGNPSFVPIPTNGSLLVANATGPVNARNDTMYSILINATGGNDYYVRCKLYNSTTSIYSSTRKVTVRYPPKLTIAEFRMYQSNDYGRFGTGTKLCDINASYGSSITNYSNCSNAGFYEDGEYRAEFEICNDQLFGKDVSITGLVHGNLTSAYIGDLAWMLCESGSDTSGTGSGTLDLFENCDWNTTVPNGLYIDATADPPLVGSKVANTRTGYSCRWYVYFFKPNAVVNDTLIVSNSTTMGASIGTNPKVGGLSIKLYTTAHPQIAGFRLYQSSNMTNLGTGTKICDINSSFSSNIADNSVCTSNLTSLTKYRAEIEVCNDWALSGKNITISSLVHGNLTSSYIGSWGVCASGNGSLTANLTPINCSWNTAVPNAVYINATTAPQFTTGSRSSTSCQWFAYSFTTGPLVNSTLMISNISTQGVSSGINPVVNGLKIGLSPQSYINGVTMSPSNNLNVTDSSTFGMSCTANTSGGYNINVTIEYNSTTQGWGAIPASGANLTIDGSNPHVNVSNGGYYSHNINVSLNSFGTYWMRCRINNATTSLYSSVIKIVVYPAYLNITIGYPSPAVYNTSNPLVVGQYNTFPVNASVNCNSIGSRGDCGNVTCSIRYNQSSALPDSTISEVQGTKPFYVVSAMMVYDFSGVTAPSTSHQVLSASVFSLPPTTLQAQSEATNTQYASISSEDGVDWNYGWRFGLPGYNITTGHLFKFQINNSISSISRMDVYYKGWTSANRTVSSSCDTGSYMTRMYILNVTSGSWTYVGYNNTQTDGVISATFTSGISSLVNSSYMYVYVTSDLATSGCFMNVSTDYVKVTLQIVNKSVLSCGNIMSNQSCSFSWLVNATGVNELRDIDVNCSTTKTTVNASNSTDAYISLRGIEVHTDKGGYRMCGTVYYKVSVYDMNNNFRDDNLTIRVYDPAGNIMNESKVQTSGGIYNTSYVLPTGASLGEWMIKSFSCVLSNKTFGVGNGNGADFWKLEWQMPGKVRFSASERIPILVKFYNQMGEGAGVFGPYGYVDSTSISCPRVTGMTGVYDCSITAPSTNGTHSINIYGMAGGRMFNETRYFYVLNVGG